MSTLLQVVLDVIVEFPYSDDCLFLVQQMPKNISTQILFLFLREFSAHLSLVFFTSINLSLVTGLVGLFETNL
jgi:hypothetical protein